MPLSTFIDRDGSMPRTNARTAGTTGGLPPLHGDLILLHAPAFFDFRRRRDIYFPFLGTSGDVPITPLYEYFPLGFKTLQRYLGERGYDVRLINLSSVLLRYPTQDCDRLLAALEAPIVGIDLHWMVHVQGSLAVAKRLDELRPDIRVLLGGISSTYYGQELIRYPHVDMVMRGYDTHEPMAQLMAAVKAGRSPEGVANLLWKDATGAVRDNGFSHRPDTFACGVDWSRPTSDTAAAPSLPILEVMSTQNAGCAYNCGWCGGSREAFRRIFKRQRAMARKPIAEIEYEIDTLRRLSGANRHHFYSVGAYNEPTSGMRRFLDLIGETSLKSISYEQFFLTDDDTLRHMVRANPRTSITLSPESHDPVVAKLSGRGVYTNEAMEEWIERALEIGISQIDVWYFVGMPQQDADSVQGTVDYCGHLLHKFKGRGVSPMICPMIPFLDPASTFFEHPEEHGYRVFHRTAEEHRRGMERASLLHRMNYETRWLSRRQLVETGFEAVRQLMAIKGSVGALPEVCVRDYNAKIVDALAFIPVVHEADAVPHRGDRIRALQALGDEILTRNNMVFCSGVMNQAFPVNRHIGTRWFDEMGWDLDVLASAQISSDDAAPQERLA